MAAFRVRSIMRRTLAAHPARPGNGGAVSSWVFYHDQPTYVASTAGPTTSAHGMFPGRPAVSPSSRRTANIDAGGDAVPAPDAYRSLAALRPTIRR